MAKRRSREQLKVDRLIKAELLILKEKILEEAYPITRVKTTVLRNEMNGRVDPDTRLTMYQAYYGAYNYPKGKESGEKNTLLITMKKLIPDTTKIIIGNINEIINAPFKQKK